MKLRGKQKRYLRSQANRMKPISSIGKNGLTDVWLEQILDALQKRELIKINIQQNADVDTDDVKNFLESKSDINVVQVIGKTLLLFLPSNDEDNQTVSVEVKNI
ncbi:ribosome assembly RNA-binding protein YhbY [Apilactobacillus xinyiensis]|uniref:ribosome assembly RNA-binding protein YhbY n=1 Tax=Apilactobacillus xinyiensis TaxID=2841032 RepID=UPI001C7D081A|nr:ribosome assembly RNA-binding protein YhbY [Apilactobacillus xinyiensis]MCL0311814.1 ribosome assembly RNA-binding protein YhbY [Apilactobacillus xinyiensis]MCL0318440.1 ribosome assembly RNA-binding protein YhbY [Apilactobacillus xinyiensis]